MGFEKKVRFLCENDPEPRNWENLSEKKKWQRLSVSSKGADEYLTFWPYYNNKRFLELEQKKD